MFYSFIVWSLPKIELLETNVFHSASPNQEIGFSIRLTDFSGNISHREIQLLLGQQVIQSIQTDENGIVMVVTVAPMIEGTYNYSILCPESLERYELLTKIEYHLNVNKQIPTTINLVHYEIIPPLQIIRLELQIVCLNGSLLEGINAKFVWLTIEKYTITQENGEVFLQLLLPSTGGNYSLYYEIESTPSLTYSFGSVSLSIESISVLASMGVGIKGFVITFVVSSVLFAIPIIRQRYIV